ncbi:MAG: CotH kinase family protein [Bacteroidota bacterium]
MRTILLTLLLSLLVLSLQAQDLYAVDDTQEVRIHFAEENWAGILDSLKRAGDKERLVADVTINGKAFPKSGVRYKGNSSYFSTYKAEEKKLPFNIKLTYTDKSQRTEEGYKTLKLSNVFRDPSFVREVLSYEIARDYMPASKCNFVELYINDTYWGLYNSTQSVDGKFLEHYFGDNNGTFFKCDPPDWQAITTSNSPLSDKPTLNYIGDSLQTYAKYYELKSDSSIGWAELIQLTKAINAPNPQLEQLLDVDQTLWMLAFNNVLVNLDSYTGRLCHNYYLYKDEAGQFHPVIWDLNMSFGGFRFLGNGSQMTDEQMQKMSPFVHYKEHNTLRPLITNLLENNLYRKIYVAHIKSILDDHFTNGAYLKRARAIQEKIAPLVKKDTNKLYSDHDFFANLDTTVMIGHSKIIGLSELMEARAAYLSNHPLLKKEAPKFIDTKHEEKDSLIEISMTTTSIEQGWLYYRYGHGDFFHRVAMEQTGEQEKEGVAQINWSKTIPHQGGVQYYFVAEGKKTAALSPEKAAHEFYEFGTLEKEQVGTGD